MSDFLAVWRRGAVLGLVWLALFFVVTLGVYVLLGAVGWSGVTRALCAMGTGPLLGMCLIGVWWIVRKPALAPAAGERSTSEDDV